MKKEITPTSIDYAILGLIRNEPQSGYGIRKVFETTALGAYSNSPGTIYPALKRLQKIGVVKNKKDKDDGKNKFFITKKGIKVLRDWVVKPLEKKDIERNLDKIFLRFAFMDDLANQEEKINFIQSFQSLITIYLRDIINYHKSESSNIPLHGRLAFEHGIESYKTTLKWCKKTLILLTSKENQNEK